MHSRLTDGTKEVVLSANTQHREQSLDDKATYACAKACSMFPDTGLIRVFANLGAKVFSDVYDEPSFECSAARGHRHQSGKMLGTAECDVDPSSSSFTQTRRKASSSVRGLTGNRKSRSTGDTNVRSAHRRRHAPTLVKLVRAGLAVYPFIRHSVRATQQNLRRRWT